jgi:hypothetical protein
MEMNKNQENNQGETEILNTSKENTNAPPVTQVKTDKKCLSKFRGILYGLLSELFLAISNVFIKKAELLNGMELGLIRYFLMFSKK